MRGILQDVEEADALAGAAAREPLGHLRVLSPPAIAVHLVAPQLPRFHERVPQVTVEITAPGPVETVDEAFDISLFTRRDAPEGDFIARRLACSEVVVCAAPAYLDRRGRPQHPQAGEARHAGHPPHRHLVGRGARRAGHRRASVLCHRASAAPRRVGAGTA